MVDPKADSARNASGGEAYRQRIGGAGVPDGGSVDHPVIDGFWEDFFHGLARRRPAPSILDVAAGNGALSHRAISVLGHDTDLCSVDASPAAAASLRRRLPETRVVVADADALPFGSGSFDVITSQFGVEYAGIRAIVEAAGLLAPEGEIAFVLHNRASSIHREYSASLSALRRLKESAFIPLAVDMFRTGFEACRGADRSPYDAAAERLQRAVDEVESILEQYGQQVAGDAIANLYREVARIHQNIQRCHPDEVLGWLRRMDRELGRYAARVSFMLDAALDVETFDGVCAELRNRGLSITRAEPLLAEDGSPLAWALMTTRANARVESTSGEGERRETRDWAKRTLNTAIYELMDRGVISDPVFEAKPEWVLPWRIVIGRVRKPFSATDALWVVCGDLPTDGINAAVASSPREAARHFALKWQLDAESAASEELAAELIGSAEALYELVECQVFWP